MPSSQAVHEPAPYKLTVDAYHALAKAGHLREDARVELIDGVILELAPIGWPHGRIGGRVTRELVRAVGERGFVVPNDSLQFDRGRKAAVYARGGVGECWIVDCAGRRVEVRRGPRGDGWADTRVARPGETLEIGALPGAKVDVDALFG